MTKPADNPTQSLRRGIRACRQGNWREGLTLLTPLAREEEASGKLPGFFYGYLGHAIARCEGRKQVGLELCRHAVKVEPFRPENHLNLAQTYLLIGNRRLARRILKNGLALDSTHRGLLALAAEMGQRDTPPLPFLARNNPVNRYLGLLRHRLRQSAEERRQRLEEERKLERLG